MRGERQPPFRQELIRKLYDAHRVCPKLTETTEDAPGKITAATAKFIRAVRSFIVVHLSLRHGVKTLFKREGKFNETSQLVGMSLSQSAFQKRGVCEKDTFFPLFVPSCFKASTR